MAASAPAPPLSEPGTIVAIAGPQFLASLADRDPKKFNTRLVCLPGDPDRFLIEGRPSKELYDVRPVPQLLVPAENEDENSDLTTPDEQQCQVVARSFLGNAVRQWSPCEIFCPATGARFCYDASTTSSSSKPPVVNLREATSRVVDAMYFRLLSVDDAP